jgi:leader peptidase (prepilin peptidase)/N-methyltransferase
MGAIVASLLASPNILGLFGAGLALLMLAIALIDWQRFIIPNELTAAGFCLALLNAAAQEPQAIVIAVALAAIRGIAFALALFIVYCGYMWLRGREGIGLGDVKLAAVAGAWLDWPVMPICIEIAACVALLTYLLRQIVIGQPFHSTNRIPFGLFFAPTIWICWTLQSTIQTRP